MIEQATPLSDAEHRLLASIERRRTALLEDLRRLVNSPTGRAPHPAAVEGLSRTRDIMQRRLSALGAVCEQVPGEQRPGWLDGPSFFRGGAPAATPPVTLVARRAAVVPGSRPVLLSGHLDTVHDPDPATAFRALSVSPDGKTATGPGVVDMKGGLTIALHALEALAESGFDVPFGFILNSDEETGSFHSDRALRAEASLADRSSPDGRRYCAAIALEPANGPTGLVVARGGSGQCLLEARGKAAHVGRDFAAGRSATDLLARAIIEVHRLTEVSAGAIVNVSTLWCDQPANQVADHAAAWGNLRYGDQQRGEQLAREIAEACRTVGGGDGGGVGVSCQVSLIRPAKPATAGSTKLARHVQALGFLLRQEITFATTAGVCDGNNLQAGLQDDSREPLAVLDTLGVRGGGLHTPQEWIELASLVERCQLLALLLLRQCAGS